MRAQCGKQGATFPVINAAVTRVLVFNGGFWAASGTINNTFCIARRHVACGTARKAPERNIVVAQEAGINTARSLYRERGSKVIWVGRYVFHKAAAAHAKPGKVHAVCIYLYTLGSQLLGCIRNYSSNNINTKATLRHRLRNNHQHLFLRRKLPSHYGGTWSTRSGFYFVKCSGDPSVIAVIAGVAHIDNRGPLFTLAVQKHQQRVFARFYLRAAVGGCI